MIPSPGSGPGPGIGRVLGWLALPAFLAVLVLVALGASSEGRSQFQGRLEQEQADRSEQDEQQAGEPTGEAPRFDQGNRDQDGRGDDPFGEPGGNPGDLGDGGPTDEQRITISGPDGDLVVTTDGERVGLRPADGSPGADIDPDDLVGVRVGDDGRLEVVPLDQLGPGDTSITPADGGFDLNQPDGTRVEFRADGRNGGVTATEVAPDGTATELEPNGDGTVTLSDGTTVGPIDEAGPSGPIEWIIEEASGLPWRWIVLALALVALASLALAYHLHRRRPDDGFDVGALAGPDASDDHVEAFLARLAADDDPTRAVRIGFSVAERGLGGVPARRGDETPFEWLARVESDRPGYGPLLGTVCDLFARARFSPGRSSEADRQAMIDALRSLHHLDRRPAEV